MAKLLIYCNKFAKDDDLLGFFPGWVARLLEHFENIIVLTPQPGQYEPSSQLTVITLPREKSKRLVQFWAELWQRRKHYDTVFVLMAPAWLIAAAPLRLLQKRLVLWYAVWKRTSKLRLATAWANRVVTSVAKAFPLATKKLIAVGQGIDTEYFQSGSGRQSGQILTLGRISPVKHLEQVITAVAQLPDRQLIIVGGPANANDDSYYRDLRAQAAPLGARVIFHGRLAHDRILPFYQQADIFVNLTVAGSFDKAMLEAMACGCIVISINEGLRAFLEPVLAEKILIKSEQLTAKLVEILSLSEEEKGKIRKNLRAMVVRDHSLQVMIPKLASVLKNEK